MMLEIVRASGTSLFDRNGKEYTDLISGIAVSNLGHCHPEVLEAINKQAGLYMHLMVYGEYVQSPQVQLASELCRLLPPCLQQVFFVNSGTEAVEGALKLAKRFTGRTEIISFKRAYHGSTHGALSLMSDEYFKNAFRPLLPDVRFLDFNDSSQLDQITTKTACVVTEIIQGEAGALPGNTSFFQALRNRCDEIGALLIADEIQTAFGRTGTFFAFSDYGIEPDILLLAKGMGGGMPIGAFISSPKIMQCLMENPVLGHITTFGGHPVCCAASLATLRVLSTMDLSRAKYLEARIRNKLQHPKIKGISGKGLLLAIDLGDESVNQAVIKKCIDGGVITDWFLFAPHKLRIAPPLIISDDCLDRSLDIILHSIDSVFN